MRNFGLVGTNPTTVAEVVTCGALVMTWCRGRRRPAVVGCCLLLLSARLSLAQALAGLVILLLLALSQASVLLVGSPSRSMMERVLSRRRALVWMRC